jgi:hypothetical protein
VYPHPSRARNYLFGVGKGELRALKSILRRKPPRGLAYIDCKLAGRLTFRRAGKYIALQGCG